MPTHEGIFKHVQEQLAMVRAMDAYRKDLVGISDALAKATPSFNYPSFAHVSESLRGVMDHHRHLEAARRTAFSALASPAWSAYQSVAALLESTRPAREMTEVMAAVSKGWQAQLAPLEQMRALAMPPPALQAHIAQIAEMAALTETMSSRIPLEMFAHSFRLEVDYQKLFLSRLEDFSASYAQFFEHVGQAEERILHLPPVVTAQPAAEYFNEIDLLDTVSIEEEVPDLEEERATARNQIEIRTREPLRDSLGQTFPDLVELLDGARAAFHAQGPDYVRHFTTSLRELFTHLIHRLAPDDQIKAWSSSADDFDKGKPTRAGRLRYITREIAEERFTDFVQKDVIATVEFFKLFQGGTHEVVSSYTERQLRALWARMEGLLFFLIQISQSN